MKKSESRRNLLSHDYNDIWKTETEGFSSGYDSAVESPELDAVNQTHMGELKTQNEAEIKPSEVMNFQNTDALCEQLKYIVTMPEVCDVTFLVGPNKVPVYGVKAILGTRSRVFYKLILDRQRELEQRATSTPKKMKPRKSSKLLVDVKKYDSDDFRKIVQFVHCGAVDVTLMNVTGLLCGAYQFGLDDLKVVCWDYIQRCLVCDVSNYSAISLLDCARKYSRHKAGNRLMSKLCDFLKQRSASNVATPVMKCENTKQRTSRDLRPRSAGITTTV